MKNCFLSPMLILVFAASSLPQASAAIIVHAATPNTITAGDTFRLDINTDGTTDFSITILDNDPYSIVISGWSGNQVETNGANKALALNDGETVGTVSWQSAATI